MLLDCSSSRSRQLTLDDMIASLLQDLSAWRGESELADDISIVAIDVA